MVQQRIRGPGLQIPGFATAIVALSELFHFSGPQFPDL